MAVACLFDNLTLPSFYNMNTKSSSHEALHLSKVLKSTVLKTNYSLVIAVIGPMLVWGSQLQEWLLGSPAVSFLLGISVVDPLFKTLPGSIYPWVGYIAPGLTFY